MEKNRKKMRIFIFAAIHILFAAILLASSNKNDEFQSAMNYDQKVLDKSLNIISKKIIYFGHQSVGYNIIEGIKTLMDRYNVMDLVIRETDNPLSFKKPVFAHSQNGENTKPETKIKSFKDTISKGMGKSVNMAFFKLCYVDVTASTDIDALFDSYKKSMDTLIRTYPKVKFVHMTVPVKLEKRDLKRTIKNIIKKIIGRQVATGNEDDNVKRMEFNKKLIATYGKNVFDLARFESTRPDGKTVTSDLGGKTHYSLLPEYTTDGGHLNQEGAQFVAYNFIRFLAEK
ncbi:MAG TPA: hypothetical protein P5295_19165 [Spirochaetota bacterium]|nr:hypothetical protein [Spirochaetota bacterium]